MTYPAHQNRYDSDPADRAPDWDVVPDRTDVRPRRRGRIIRRGLFLLSLFGMAWIHYQNPSVLPQWSTAAYEAAAPFIKQAFDRPAGVAVAGADSMPGIRPSLQTETTDTPQSAPVIRVSSSDSAVNSASISGPVSGAASGPGDAAPATTQNPPVMIASLPPIKSAQPAPAAKKPKAADRKHERARKAGLHPDLSYVLLAQMSDDDFKNARIAIRTAVAKTPDDATYTWPKAKSKKSARTSRSPKSQPATFKIHFVTGASPGCRRYVVTVEKNRWMTTALPMEKCGAGVMKNSGKTATAKQGTALDR